MDEFVIRTKRPYIVMCISCLFVREIKIHGYFIIKYLNPLNISPGSSTVYMYFLKNNVKSYTNMYRMTWIHL